jgi:phage-related protein
MAWSIEYYSTAVERTILRLPPGLLARYVRLADFMLEFGPALGLPHTRAMGGGRFELRVKGQEGIARVFYGTAVAQRIIMLHVFIKKSQKTPPKELAITRRRLQEVLSHDAPRAEANRPETSGSQGRL